jgi:hypothetical protein
MSTGQKSGSTTTTTKSDPWEGQQPFLKTGFESIKNTYIDPTTGNVSGNKLPDYYPGQTIATDSPETQAALQARTGRALYGSPLTTAAQGELTKTLRGDYLNNNPYIDATYDKAARGVTRNYNEVINPGIDSAFTKAGRFGSGAYAAARNSADKTLGGELAGLATNIYGQNYSNERQNQVQGQLYAPDLANQDYYDINQLSSVGDYRTNLAQAQIDADRAKYQYNNTKDQQALQQYMDLIQGNYGGTQQQINPYTRNSTGETLGQAAQIAAIAGPLLMSDSRLKENIIPLGKENGHNIYEFSYIGQPERYVGVMAQEVMKTNPEAVAETPIGYAVYYDKIGVNMRRVA